MFIKNSLLVTLLLHFYNCELQIREKTLINQKSKKTTLLVTFIA